MNRIVAVISLSSNFLARCIEQVYESQVLFVYTLQAAKDVITKHPEVELVIVEPTFFDWEEESLPFLDWFVNETDLPLILCASLVWCCSQSGFVNLPFNKRLVCLGYTVWESPQEFEDLSTLMSYFLD